MNVFWWLTASLLQHLRLLDLEALQAADLSRVHFVHVEVGVLLQLELPDAARENNLMLASSDGACRHNEI